MRLRRGLPFLPVLVLFVLAAACSKTEAPKPAAPPAVSAVAEGKTLFEQKCSVCHGLDRATARGLSKEEWATIVKDMQGKKADWISDADAGKIVEYLATDHGKK